MGLVQLIGGNFADFAGNPVENGILWLTLSADSIEGGNIFGPFAPAKILLDATGSVLGVQFIYANDDLLPAGSFYWVEVRTQYGARVFGPARWVIAGSSPVDISTTPPMSFGGWGNSFGNSWG